MPNSFYIHSHAPGFQSKLIQSALGFLGVKKRMKQKIEQNGYSKNPAKIPKSILKKLNVGIDEVDNRKIWTISPKQNRSNAIILFLHGGAFVANISSMHWLFIEQLISLTGAAVVVPDYPLAPDTTCTITYQFLDAVYAKLIHNVSQKQVILMGDSAGGTLALGFALTTKNKVQGKPHDVILFSPWLDATLSNPDIARFDPLDKILNVEGLKLAAQKFAGGMDLKDVPISPINGDFSNLGAVFIFAGTHELFVADTRKLMQLTSKQHVNMHYYEYPAMFHDWVLVPNLPEAKDVLQKVAKIVKPMI